MNIIIISNITIYYEYVSTYIIRDASLYIVRSTRGIPYAETTITSGFANKIYNTHIDINK